MRAFRAVRRLAARSLAPLLVASVSAGLLLVPWAGAYAADPLPAAEFESTTGLVVANAAGAQVAPTNPVGDPLRLTVANAAGADVIAGQLLGPGDDGLAQVVDATRSDTRMDTTAAAQFADAAATTSVDTRVGAPPFADPSVSVAFGDPTASPAAADVGVSAPFGDPTASAAMGDPSATAAVGDPGAISTWGDPAASAPIGDPTASAAMGDPSATAAVADAGAISAWADPAASVAFGDPTASAATGDPSVSAEIGDPTTGAATGYPAAGAPLGELSAGAASYDPSASAATGDAAPGAPLGDPGTAVDAVAPQTSDGASALLTNTNTGLTTFTVEGSGRATSVTQPAGPSQVSFQVAAIVCVILSGDGRVMEVWSNTTDPQVQPTFRLGGLGGQLVDASDGTWQAYRSIRSRISWSAAPGRIFQASSESPLDRLLDGAADVLNGFGLLGG